MTKLIIQIPCLNEADTIGDTISKLPSKIDGIDAIEILIIDDGSTDDTVEKARAAGINHIVRHRRNRGLAAAFQSGVSKALSEGADVIVNTDADGQYEGADIDLLVRPIINGTADIAVGDRGVSDNVHFGVFKRQLQRLGSLLVKSLSKAEINDAVSGFRAFSRDAAKRLTITTEFSYTTDMLIQAGRKRMAIASVPVRTHETKRPSRLFKSIPRFIVNQMITIGRAYTTYNPLRVFVTTGLFLSLVGILPITRFLWFYLQGDGNGHLQSLVIGSAIMIVGALFCMLGVLADLTAANRKMIETTLLEVRDLRDQISQKEESELLELNSREGENTL
ncbi:glycosyltransferase family 2 protein [Qipengyuania seohaensis]|uniref:glycosyltransferase family 2 protein n=1 Tax=Qipengyuania seohaensis TaxID=266951 RepID=UPI000C22B640|nr:glycosyltransferase family 2 protein [Qipengyuania seohaensis]